MIIITAITVLFILIFGYFIIEAYAEYYEYDKKVDSDPSRFKSDIPKHPFDYW